MSEQNPTPWEISADEVLAVLLRNDKAYQQACYEWSLKAFHMPPGPRRFTMHAINALRRANEPVHIAALVDRSDGQVTPGWLAERVAAYSEAMLGERFKSNVEICRSRAKAYQDVTNMQYAIDELKKAGDEDERRRIVGEVISNLGTEADTSIEDSTATATAARFLDMLDAPPLPTLTTGVTWLDNNTGGLMRKQIWWIAAAYKKRKSTLMRNMAIGLLRKGASVTIAAREGSQELVTAQIIAMLAVEQLHREGVHDARDSRGVPLDMISATLLMKLRNTYKRVMDKRQVQAISIAVREYMSWGNRLRIYDTTEEHGGLSDFQSLETVIERDIQMYGVDVVFVDYFQLFTAGHSTMYDNASHMARQAQQIAAEKNIAMVMLAQLNEESVKGSNDNYSPGVKGGGDPAATADFLLTTDYPKNSDGDSVFTRLRIMIKLARHGEAQKFTEVPIHPASGLILPTVEIESLSGGAQ
jgi:archaellum biogenesis ATPase FlaH